MALPFAVAACGELQLAERGGPPTWPPERALFSSLVTADDAIHARALHGLLESGIEGEARRWVGATDGVDGTVLMLETYHFIEDDVVCRRFEDALSIGSARETVTDAACWSSGDWVWARTGSPQQPVLSNAAREERFYTVRSGGALDDVAKATGVPLVTLRRLNPDLEGRLDKGTKVRLP